MRRTIMVAFLLLLFAYKALALSTEAEVTPENISQQIYQFNIRPSDQGDGTTKFILTVSPGRYQVSDGQTGCTLRILTEPVDLSRVVDSTLVDGRTTVIWRKRNQPVLAWCNLLETSAGDTLIYEALVSRDYLGQAALTFVNWGGEWSFSAFTFVLGKFTPPAR